MTPWVTSTRTTWSEGHFDALVRAVADDSGAVIKTIGDAITPTFVSPADGVRAAIDMMSVLAEFNATASADLVIKIGIHRGRSIAVTLNDRIGYFGEDVNIVSRVQQLAGASEIVISGEVYGSPDVVELLAPFAVREEEGIYESRWAGDPGVPGSGCRQVIEYRRMRAVVTGGASGEGAATAIRLAA